ncbi:MAG TPA: nucleotidyltransferase family protein [Thermopetrobacter sp.]|nr:nucleotidyltransferase family protein [Thermopetrobacter sp.]
MQGAVTQAMIFAAGLGQRMRPLTEHTPKPLIEVAGRPIIDHALQRLRAQGVRRVVVNMHWLGEQIARWAARQPAPPEIIVSDERERLLDTGGGLKKALAHFAPAPLFAVNGDSIWLDGPTPALAGLQSAWDEARMDILLLTVDPARAVGHGGGVDFTREADGRLRRAEAGGAGEIFTGVYLLHPRLFAAAPDGPFSMNRLFDRAMTAGRLFGLPHDGRWLHVGTPQAIPEAERIMRQHDKEAHPPADAS